MMAARSTENPRERDGDRSPVGGRRGRSQLNAYSLSLTATFGRLITDRQSALPKGRLPRIPLLMVLRHAAYRRFVRENVR
jgi:hypothetical protein